MQRQILDEEIALAQGERALLDTQQALLSDIISDAYWTPPNDKKITTIDHTFGKN